MFQTTWRTNYKHHVIELENRPWRERLLVDGLVHGINTANAGAGDPNVLAIGDAPADEVVLTARTGRWMQVRPKGATAKDRTWSVGAEDSWVEALPRGFYLRTRFTEALLRDLAAAP